MAVKLASILVATIAVSISILEGQQIGIQEENALEYYSNPGQERVIQGNQTETEEPHVTVTKPRKCKKENCKGTCATGNTEKGFTTYTFRINKRQECFTVYRPLSRSNQSLPVIATVQMRSKNKLTYRGSVSVNFKSTSDMFNRAAAKYGFARILISSNHKCGETKRFFCGHAQQYGKAIIDWIVKRPSEFDASKIYLEGFSMNGQLANYLGSFLHQKIAGIFSPTATNCFTEEKPMVRCMMANKGDKQTIQKGIQKKIESSWDGQLREGNDPRLFIFPGGAHKHVFNRWDWEVGCFGIKPPCSKTCEQTLFDCMDSSDAKIGELSGVKEGKEQFAKCMFKDEWLASPCSECGPTLDMLKRSKYPLVERFKTFGAPIPPTEHKRSNESVCVWENTWD